MNNCPSVLLIEYSYDKKSGPRYGGACEALQKKGPDVLPSVKLLSFAVPTDHDVECDNFLSVELQRDETDLVRYSYKPLENFILQRKYRPYQLTAIMHFLLHRVNNITSWNSEPLFFQITREYRFCSAS